MTYDTQPHLRIIILSGVLAIVAIAKIVDSHPRLVGWPSAYILSDWTPGPLRVWALQSLSDTLSKDDVPLIRRMLRSEDPRIRRRGIVFFDRHRSMDEFFELERLTRDPDSEVRATAHKYLPFPRDESLAIDALMAGLRDDSDKVVAVAAEKLLLLRARQALPELIDYMEAKRRTGAFNHADVIVGNVASEMAGLKLQFRAYEPYECGSAEVWEAMERDRPFPRAVRAARSFGRGLLGNWDDDRGVEPYALALVDPGVVADDFAERDKLLVWWSKRRHPGQTSGSSALRSRKVRNSSK